MSKAWDKVGSMFLRRREPDGAGNSPQYLLGTIRVGGQTVQFTAHSNPNKKSNRHPDFLIFVKPQGR